MALKLSTQLSLLQNVLTLVYFFFFGTTYLLFYNTILNLSDRLIYQFEDYETMDYMSTFPIFYNWFNFAVAVLLTVLASYLPQYPSNIIAHASFVLHILLFVGTPFILVYTGHGATCFWLMIVIATLNGVPTPMNSSVFMGLSGMFSSIHSAMYFIGMAAGGLISSLLRMSSEAIFKNSPNNDYFLTFYLNGAIAILSYVMFMVMYFTVPLTEKCFAGEPSPDSDYEQLTEDPTHKKTSVLRLIWRLKFDLLSVGLVFFVTLSIFPGFFVGTNYDEAVLDSATSVMIVTFDFMLGDIISRFAVYIPIKWNSYVVLVITVARFVFFVPVFIWYYNVFTEPFTMFAIMFLFSFTNGYFSSHAIQLAYAKTDQNEMKVAGNLVMVSMNIGLSLGGTILFVLGMSLPSNKLPVTSV